MSGVNDFKGFVTQSSVKSLCLQVHTKHLIFLFLVTLTKKKGPKQRSSLVFMQAKGFLTKVKKGVGTIKKNA